MQDLASEIRVGVAWSGIAQLGVQSACLVISVILTRLWSPRDFVLIGTVVVFTGFATILTIRNRRGPCSKTGCGKHYKNAVFWASTALGVLMTLIMAAAAPYITSFYGVSALQPLTVAVSLIFFINRETFVVREVFAGLLSPSDLTVVAAVLDYS